MALLVLAQSPVDREAPAAELAWLGRYASALGTLELHEDAAGRLWYRSVGSSSCGMSPPARSIGAWTFEEDELSLSPYEDSSRRPPRFDAFAWAGRRYLVETDRRREFANHVNAGHEPPTTGRRGFFLCRSDERVGAGELPPGYRRRVLDEPLEATVLAVGPARPGTLGRTVVDAVLDVGLRDGAWEGMRIFRTRHLPEIVLVDVRWTNSVAEVRGLRSSIQKGDRCSTSLHQARLIDQPPLSLERPEELERWFDLDLLAELLRLPTR